MSEITLYRPGDLILEGMTVAELRRELATSMELSASHLVHLAAIWQELERRGEDLSELRSGLATYLPLIARGELNAHLVVRYAGHAMLLRHLAALPPPTQERLIESDDVTIVDLIDGEFVETTVPLTRIETRRLKDVFTDHILTPSEQREIVARRRPGNRKNSIIRKAQKAGLKNFNHPHGAKIRTVNIMMTDEEWNAFKAFTRGLDITISGFVRETILSAMKT